MIIYQVLPRLWGRGRFSDWDVPAFSYLKTLGITHVWYTGVIRHSTGKPWVKGDPGSPYSIENYRDVNPYLADNPDDRLDEFKSLIKRTHDAGLSVIIDFIPNHVAPDCKDVPVLDRCDYDWTDTRKVDYSRREAWDSMLGILDFWAGLGVDGFRCDMVEMVPVDLMKFLIEGVRMRHPGTLFIAEVYNQDSYRNYIEYAGFDYLYDKSGVYDSMRAILCHGQTARALSWNWQRLSDMQGHMLNFLENHDEQRLASPYFAGDARMGYAALAFEALFNDAAFMLYAGGELGETASEGAEGRTSIFNWSHPASLSSLYSHIREGFPLPVAEQEVLDRYRAILPLKNEEPFSGGACHDLCYCSSAYEGFDPDRHFAFLRYTADRASLVFCNFSGLPASVTIRIPDGLITQKCHPWRDGISVEAKPYDAEIISLLQPETRER